MTNSAQSSSPRLREALILSVALVIASKAVPTWLTKRYVLSWLGDSVKQLGTQNIVDLVGLILWLGLCFAAARRSGLSFGKWRGHTTKTLGVCALPIVATAIIYPLTSSPFTGDRIGVWLISPAAQELLFTGYIYGLLQKVSPGPLFRRLPVQKAAWLTATLFALWHLPNFQNLGAGYVWFQLAYTFAGMVWMLLARHWTGSILPAVVTHMAVNFIAWSPWFSGG